MLHFTEYFAVHSGEPGFVYVLLMDGTEYTEELWNVFLHQCVLSTDHFGGSAMMWEGYIRLCKS